MKLRQLMRRYWWAPLASAVLVAASQTARAFPAGDCADHYCVCSSEFCDVTYGAWLPCCSTENGLCCQKQCRAVICTGVLCDGPGTCYDQLFETYWVGWVCDNSTNQCTIL